MGCLFVHQFLSQVEPVSFFTNSMVKNGNTVVGKYIREQNRLMTLNPLGYDPIKDIDEIQNRNRRETDDPYIKATMRKVQHGSTNT